MDNNSPAILKAEVNAAILTLAVGIVVTGVKFAAYWLTGSVAVFSDAMENTVNVFTAAFALYALWLSSQPADREHPYGHGKVEFLSAGIEGGMVLLTAFLIGGKAVAMLLRGGEEIGYLRAGLVLVVAAMLMNGLMGLYLSRLGRRRESAVLSASGVHLLSDAMITVAALAALICVRITGWMPADPAIALAVAIYVAWTGLRLMRRAGAELMDEQNAGDRRMLTELLNRHVGPNGKFPRICSYHKLRHRHSGRYTWVEFHIMLPDRYDLKDAHSVGSAIEHEIELALGYGNATAHVEPCTTPNCQGCAAAISDVPPPPPVAPVAPIDKPEDIKSIKVDASARKHD